MLLTSPDLLTTHYSVTTHDSPLTTHYSLLTTHYSPLTTHYSLLTTHSSLHTTHYSLLSTRLLTYLATPTTIHHPPTPSLRKIRSWSVSAGNFSARGNPGHVLGGPHAHDERQGHEAQRLVDRWQGWQEGEDQGGVQQSRRQLVRAAWCPSSSTVHPAASAAMPQGLPHHLPIQGVGAEVTSPATWSERGLPSLRGGSGRPQRVPSFPDLEL